jgi:adenine-specific DNA-methyltransferase
MKIVKLNPKKSLNKAFLKQRPLRSEIELFKSNLIRLLGKVDEIEREENQKNHVRDFLRDTYYKETYEINTKDNKDLVIHLGKTNKDKVGVIIEAKRPGNKNEMLTESKPNVKAFQELVLYYLRERIDENNIDIKYLIATNIYEWYIFEASYFEKLFVRNRSFVKQYEEWRDGQKVLKDTTLFYNSIAKPFIDNLEDEIHCTFFDIREYDKFLRNTDKKDDKNLIALQKLLSPFFLLKVPFANDSNSLNEKFYKELLHIIGLEEVRKGTKNIIRRKEKNKQAGSLIENAINILETEDALYKIKDRTIYGQTKNEQLFNIALELSLTWINRILFLKLLEGQLITYHKGDKEFRFLNSEMINDFDELYKLFHQVLARNINERTPSIKLKYARIPYLNSSLFEISELEDLTIKINSLDNSEIIELINSTILKGEKKKTTFLPALEYLFKFLDSYDFASEGGEDIAEDNKTIINASVLGKVFEKINGYKDGSIFTPGIITMYMSRQSIRLSVIQKFNEYFKSEKIAVVSTFEDLYNRIEKLDFKTANNIINSIRVCDPAVGSGHFLVSVLNELIFIKSELGILVDKSGKRLKGYEIVVDNDELIISDDDGIFEYNYCNKESQRVQETIFNERQTIIENCLFGVDINPNSVKICRLRLWIELLKSSYYKAPDFIELETLPNIDINIKCGNSLIGRYSLDSDLRKALQKSKWNINSYRLAIMTYRNAKSKDEKRVLEKLIDEIKNSFETEIQLNDKRFKKLRDLKRELISLTDQGVLFDKTKKEKADWNKRVIELTSDIKSQDQIIEDIKNNVIFKNAFEWRFEFPEVLNDRGEFEGFDLVIGNPPYLNFKMYSQAEREIFKNDFKEIFDGKADIYYYFFIQALRIIKPDGIITYITSRYWLEAEFAKKLRKSLANTYSIQEIIDFKNLTVFSGIGIKASTVTIQKKDPQKGDTFNYRFIDNRKIKSIEIENFKTISIFNDDIRSKSKWVFGVENELNIYKKIESDTVTLETIANCKQGIVTGLDKAFITTTQEFKNIPKKFVKTWVKVGDISNYLINPIEDRQLIYTNEIKDISKYPELLKRLEPFKNKLSGRREAKSGKIRWYDLQWGRDPKTFNSPKLICRFKASRNTFALDNNKYFSSADTTIVVLKKSYAKEYDLKYILALVNSKLLDFYFKSYGKLMDYRFEYYPGPVGQLRIKKAKNQIDFVKIVDKIIEEKSKNFQANTITLEKQIDNLVYKLYNITKEEQIIIETEK